MNFTFTLTEIKDVAQQVYEYAKDKKVWAMHGEMGAGKTTFIHALCENLKVTSTVSSPTYSIINEYKSETVNTVYHIDLYRLKDEEEALQAGVEDCIISGDLCLIEWPERAPDLFPENSAHIIIEAVNEDTRKLTVE